MALTQISTKGVKDGTILNADVNASAAIAGTKIDPTFTSNITISNSVPKLLLTDTGNNPDYDLRNQDGAFVVRDTTNSANRLIVQSDGHIDIAGNVDFGAGIDVTGNITSTGNYIITNASPSISLIDSDANSDFKINVNGGIFSIKDQTNVDASRLAIDSSGNIGINTASPNQLLEVANSSGGATISISTDEQAGSQASKKYNNLDFTGFNNTVMARIQSWDESSSTGHGYLTFFTNKNGVGFTEKLRIDPDGNLGLGTVAPSELFTINGADQSALIRTSNAVGTAKLKFEADGTNYAGIGLENTSLVFRCSNSSTPTSRMTIAANGVTSILNASPPATGVSVLHVSNSGSATTLGTAATLRVSNNGGNGAYSVFEAESGSGSIRLANDGQFYVTGASTFSNDIRVDRGTTIDGIVGQAYAGYFGLKHADQTINSEYMILSNDSDTFISCSAGYSVRIRPNANNSAHELLVTSDVTLAKAAFGAGRVAIDPDSYTDYSGGFGNIADGGSWGATGMWVHGGGTGDAAAIAHNGSNLYFGLQNGSAANSMATYMMIEPTGDITMEKDLRFTGKVIKRNDFSAGFLVGAQNNQGASDAKTNPIFTIGTSHLPTNTALSDMYGIGYSHGNASFTPSGVGWGMYVAADGDARVYLDASHGNIYFGGNLASVTRHISSASGDYGSMQINNGAKGGWSGYSIDGHSVFMSNGATGSSKYIGIYDDNVNQWVLLHARSAYVRLYYAGVIKLETTNAGVSITGTLTASSTKSFRISHPLSELSETKDLVHTAIEGPQMDLMYRGKVDLVNGTATVNIDTKSGMTEGTFDVLNRDVQCFTTNETGWTNVKGSVTGNKLTIVAENNSCTDTISWMVIGERKDNDVVSSEVTDDNGDLIVEPDKQIISEDPNMDS